MISAIQSCCPWLGAQSPSTPAAPQAAGSANSGDLAIKLIESSLSAKGLHLDKTA